MERLAKIAILTGMAMAIIVFSLIMYTIVPDIIRNNSWDRFDEEIDDDVLFEKFRTLTSYQVFIEKYPNYGETFRPQHNGGDLKLNYMNFTSLTQIELDLDYNARDDYMRQNLDCRNDHNDWRLRIDGPLISNFLENVNCLAIEKFTGQSSEIVIATDGDPSYAKSFALIAD